MNILINSSIPLDPVLVDKLARLPQISIYLALSLEDALRILRENRPEIMITDIYMATSELFRQIEDSYPEIEIYLYKTSSLLSDTYVLLPYSRFNVVRPDLNSLLNPDLTNGITHLNTDAGNASGKKQINNMTRRRSK